MVILDFLRSIPDKLGGVWLYSKNRTLYSIYREIWHFIGGATVGGMAVAIGTISDTVRIVVITLFGTCLAGVVVHEELKDQETRQTAFKTFFDLLVWWLGFILLVVLT